MCLHGGGSSAWTKGASLVVPAIVPVLWLTTGPLTGARDHPADHDRLHCVDGSRLPRGTGVDGSVTSRDTPSSARTASFPRGNATSHRGGDRTAVIDRTREIAEGCNQVYNCGDPCECGSQQARILVIERSGSYSESSNCELKTHVPGDDQWRGWVCVFIGLRDARMHL